ncbi:pyridoxamine 5'-phosphate oxidase family protein [Mycobacterium sp. 050134]|uniref:pyridoxamine 5'-phosphate oxidase family protein n=1 Tax=Mycobacterium sp. 050134 TaxID=3096111 RepID=UPI002ED82459
MTDGEVDTYLTTHQTLTCATLSRAGRPRLLPLWYVPHTPTRLDCWAFAASQKVRNLQSVPQATVQVESGLSYAELRGVSMECDVEIIDDIERLAAIGLALTVRYAKGRTAESAPDGVREFVAKQAAKRVGRRFQPTRIISWGHGKLGGVY